MIKTARILFYYVFSYTYFLLLIRLFLIDYNWEMGIVLLVIDYIALLLSRVNIFLFNLNDTVSVDSFHSLFSWNRCSKVMCLVIYFHLILISH